MLQQRTTKRMPSPGYYYYSNLRSRRAFWAICVIFLLIVLTKHWRTLSAAGSMDAVLLYLHQYRIVTSIVLISALFLYLYRSQRRKHVAYGAEDYGRTNYHYASFEDPEHFVLAMEDYRQSHGYKPGWLYYRCKELNLLDVYETLCNSGRIEHGGRFTAFDKSNISDNEERKQAPPQSGPEDYYAVLGLSPTNCLTEIRKGYSDMVKLYHPDRVHSLGPELQDLAKQKTVAINRAYEELRKKHASS